MALEFLGRLARARRLATGGNSNTETTVLRAGEFGFVTDTGDLRVGDGITGFNNLRSVRNHRRVRTVTATATLEVNDEVVIVNAAGATNQTLPNAAAAGMNGRIITIKNIGAGTATVLSAGGTVDGTTALTTGLAYRAISNGTNWYSI